MKKRVWIGSLVAQLAVCGLLFVQPLTVSAAEVPVVRVNIANGDLVLAGEEVRVTDQDGDEVLTINDALIIAHDQKYTGGAAAGFGSEMGDYGLSMTKLWGVENGGSYGYRVNHVMSMGLADPIQDGDVITAYVYTDTVTFSDAYTYFDKDQVCLSAKDTLTLTLYKVGYDSNWQEIQTPVAGATVTVDSKTVGTTDANGKITLTLSDVGSHQISASSETLRMVPPICLATVTETTASAPTGDIGGSLLVAAALSAALCCYTVKKR